MQVRYEEKKKTNRGLVGGLVSDVRLLLQEVHEKKFMVTQFILSVGASNGGAAT